MMPFVLRMVWRETRAGWRHFGYFLTCIAVGVGALVAVSLFAAHVERAVNKEARSLLGGDLEIRLSRPIGPAGRDVLDALGERGIAFTHVSELVAMAAALQPASETGRPTQIVELKAVEPQYPLYGSVSVQPGQSLTTLLRTAPCSSGASAARSDSRVDRNSPNGICHGAVVQESLLIRMGLTLGDRLTIGEASFTITGVVRTEPDRVANAFSLGPRVLISQEALQAARLVQTGSRIRERYLLRTPPTLQPEPLMYELRGRLKSEGARVSGYRDAQPQLKQFLAQLTRYLGLIGLTALFIGGVGVATSVHAFIREKIATIAILKTLGADSATVIATYVTQALALGLAGSAAGVALGFSLQRALPPVIAALFDSDLLVQLGFAADLTASSLPSLAKGMALGVLATLLFVLWPLLAIRDIKPAAVLRREVAEARPAGEEARHGRRPDRLTLMTAGCVGLGLVALAMWQAQSWRVGLLFIAAFLGAVLILAGGASLLLRGLRRSPRPAALVLKQAVGNVIRPGSQAIGITMAIGVGVMVVVTVSLVERSLLTQVGDRRPADSPTFFFIDIQPDQKETFLRVVSDRLPDVAPDLTPLVRSRLSAVKGEPVTPEALTEEEDRKEKEGEKEERRKKWYFTREYVLTFLSDLPKDNRVVAGEWWKPNQRFDRPLLSIEEEAARALGVTIGDAVAFDIQGTTMTAEVSSIRQVEWGNFSTNFYMILSPGALDDAPITYVGTVRVKPADEVRLQQAVVAALPNVTAINVGDVLQTFATVLDRLSLAIRAVAIFCVLAGALVMGAALAATRYRRLYESVILKALGATRGVIARSFAAEYALLGALGGLIGCVLASLLSWALLAFVFDLPWALQPSVLAAGFLATIALTVLVGFVSTYRILGHPPLAVLRHE